MVKESYIVINSMKKSVGEYEGKKFDSTKVNAYLIDELNLSEKEKGYFADDYKVGDSGYFENLLGQGIEFPALCSAIVEFNKTSRGYNTIISDIKFIKKIDLLSLIID